MDIPDEPPGREDIIVAMRGIPMGRELGTSGMRTELLQEGLRAQIGEKNPDTQRWEKLVSFKKLMFQEGHLLVDMTCTSIVILPKGVG